MEFLFQSQLVKLLSKIYIYFHQYQVIKTKLVPDLLVEFSKAAYLIIVQ